MKVISSCLAKRIYLKQLFWYEEHFNIAINLNKSYSIHRSFYNRKNFQHLHCLQHTSQSSSRKFSSQMQNIIDETNRKLSSFQSTQRLGEAVAFFTKVQSLKHVDATSYDLMFALLSEQNEIKKANIDYMIDLYREKRDKKIPSTNFTYQKIFFMCFRYGMYQLGITFLTEMKKEKIKRDTGFFTVLFKSISLFGSNKAMEHLLNYMKSEGISLNADMYTSLLKCHSIARDIFRFRATLVEMQKQGIHMTVNHFATIVDFYGKNSQVSEMIQWFNQLKEIMKPSVSVYNALIDGILKSENSSLALSYYRKMKDEKITPDLVTYNILLKGLSKSPTAMASIIYDMRESKTQFDYITYVILVTRLGDNKNFKEAEEILDKMENEKIRAVEAYNSFLLRLAKAGKFRKMESIVERMKSKDVVLNVDTYKALVYASHQRTFPGRLKEVIRRMEEEGIPPNNEHLATPNNSKKDRIFHLLFGPLFITMLFPPYVYATVS